MIGSREYAGDKGIEESWANRDVKWTRYWSECHGSFLSSEMGVS